MIFSVKSITVIFGNTYLTNRLDYYLYPGLVKYQEENVTKKFSYTFKFNFKYRVGCISTSLYNCLLFIYNIIYLDKTF